MYKKKVCPVCATEHKQRGPYCSKSCSNKGRLVKPSTRKKLSAAMKKRMAHESMKDATWSFRERGKLVQKQIKQKLNPEEFEFNPEDLYLPPITHDTPDGAFSDGKDLWFED